MVDYLYMKIFVTRVVIGSVQWLDLQPLDMGAVCTIFCTSFTKAEVRNLGSQIRLLNFFFCITEIKKTDSFGQSMHVRGLTFQGRESSENDEWASHKSNLLFLCSDLNMALFSTTAGEIGYM